VRLREEVLAVLREHDDWMSTYGIELDVYRRTGRFPSRDAILHTIIVLLTEGKVEVQKRYVGSRVWLRFRSYGGSGSKAEVKE